MYANARYIGSPATSIRVEIGGVVSYVPLDEANADYRAIVALAAAGTLEILPAE